VQGENDGPNVPPAHQTTSDCRAGNP
jgi:hypothetical protein